MTSERLTENQIERLNELNKICMDCLENARKNYLTKDFRACMTCPVGFSVHRLDNDDIDGYNSARYEAYFTA